MTSSSSFRARWILLIAAAVAVAALGAGCKQGPGERCQTSADCENGLTCSQADPKVCGGLDEQQVDAYIPPMDAEIAVQQAPVAPGAQ